VDYDNDGIFDFISGSYDPGDLYLFRGLGEGKYAAVEKIIDESGLSLVHHPDEFGRWNELSDAEQESNDQESVTLRVSAFGSWPATVDWDDDGDLDVLIGSFAGYLFLRTNKGTRDQPVYDAIAIQVEANGKPLHVNMHAAPAVADWDADGLWDLVVGSGDGGVGWFRNTGSAQEPRLGAYQQLVAPASDTKFFEQNLKPGEQPTHGVRAQICVTDYNGDGRLDLIVGDYSQVSWLRKLSDKDQAEQEKLIAKQKKMVAVITKLRKQFADDYRNEEFQAEIQEFAKVYQRLDKKRKAFCKESRGASFVWLFLRQETDESSFDHQTPAVTLPVNTKEKSSKKKSSKKNQSSTDQLSLFAAANPVAGSPGQYELTIDILIKAGWHLYSDVATSSAHRATTVNLIMPDGVTAKGDWNRAPGLPAPNNPTDNIYTDFATFSHLIESDGAKSYRIEVVVDYEVCNKDHCLPVAKLRQTVRLEP